MNRKSLYHFVYSFALFGLLFFTSVACKEQHVTLNQATVSVNIKEVAKTYDSMIFGGFLEHFGHQIYSGVFDPGSPLADELGFRTDVIEALNELNVAVIQWSGCCFVDSYHWKKGVGKNRESYNDIEQTLLHP
jgi:alpha-L-arabinofuranosidase